MRLSHALLASLLAAVLGLPACTSPGPLGGLATLADPADAGRRAAIEVAVKSTHSQILSEIDRGGGPALSAAYDAARVPEGDRAARTLQLSGDLGLYASNPGALALAIAGFGAPG